MVQRDVLTEYLAALLALDDCSDYCPNGLQVEGKAQINKIVTGVTACYDLLAAALANGADALLVHHGYFWRGEATTVTGIKRQRLAALLKHDVNLYAYHLPLDIHPVYGNNAQLAQVLNLQVTKTASVNQIPNLLYLGVVQQPISGEALAQQIQQSLQREPLHIAGSGDSITKIAWCTGAAQGFIEQALNYDVDAYLTGEVSEQTVHIARETGLHFYAAGHHATERYGVQALGEHLAEQFSLTHEFIDIPNPV